MTECPECGRAIEPKDFIEGEIFPCPDCGLELEVTGLEPFRRRGPSRSGGLG